MEIVDMELRAGKGIGKKAWIPESNILGDPCGGILPQGALNPIAVSE
jgi:hypothetical protein